MASVKVENLHKSFGEVEALKGINLDIADGEFFCLLGPPGAGKTTVLRSIAGLDKPESGDIWLDEERINEVHPKDRDVAMVFEDLALYPHWTAFDNLAHPLKLRKLPRDEIQERVHQIATLLRITHLLDRRPGTFSGGERRRVAVGRALVRQPCALLLDQPLTDLDAKIRQEMTGELKRLQSETRQTMIYATHDYEEAVAMADRIMVINQGQEEQTDSPENIYTLPANTFVAGFVGSPAMNLLISKVGLKNGEIELKHPGFHIRYRTLEKVSLPEAAILGVRPEHVEIGDESHANAVWAQVDIVQVLGDEQIVDLRLGDGSMIKMITSLTHRLELGDQLSICFPPSAILIFDAESSQRISEATFRLS